MCRLVGKQWLRALLWPTIICAFEFSPLDLWLQDHFYDHAAGGWRVHSLEPFGRLFFYTGPKTAIIGVGLVLVALLVGPGRWRARFAPLGYHADRRDLGLALTAAGVVPALVGALKNISGVYCPAELARYRGSAPYLRPFAAEFCGVAGRHCWPITRCVELLRAHMTKSPQFDYRAVMF